MYFHSVKQAYQYKVNNTFLILLVNGKGYQNLKRGLGSGGLGKRAAAANAKIQRHFRLI